MHLPVDQVPARLSPSMTLNHAIKTEAGRLGFALVGVTTPDSPPHLAVYSEWLREGRHGEMGYIATERARWRTVPGDPGGRDALPGGRSACTQRTYPVWRPAWRAGSCLRLGRGLPHRPDRALATAGSLY